MVSWYFFFVAAEQGKPEIRQLSYLKAQKSMLHLSGASWWLLGWWTQFSINWSRDLQHFHSPQPQSCRHSACVAFLGALVCKLKLSCLRVVVRKPVLQSACTVRGCEKHQLLLPYCNLLFPLPPYWCTTIPASLPSSWAWLKVRSYLSLPFLLSQHLAEGKWVNERKRKEKKKDMTAPKHGGGESLL